MRLAGLGLGSLHPTRKKDETGGSKPLATGTILTVSTWCCDGHTELYVAAKNGPGRVRLLHLVVHQFLQSARLLKPPAWCVCTPTPRRRHELLLQSEVFCSGVERCSVQVTPLRFARNSGGVLFLFSTTPTASCDHSFGAWQICLS